MISLAKRCLRLAVVMGTFLKALGDQIGNARLIGFEPGVETANAEKLGLEVYQDYFVAERDLPRFTPDVLICRHVLEHLEAPRDFVAEIGLLVQYARCVSSVSCRSAVYQ